MRVFLQCHVTRTNFLFCEVVNQSINEIINDLFFNAPARPGLHKHEALDYCLRRCGALMAICTRHMSQALEQHQEDCNSLYQEDTKDSNINNYKILAEL